MFDITEKKSNVSPTKKAGAKTLAVSNSKSNGDKEVEDEEGADGDAQDESVDEREVKDEPDEECDEIIDEVGEVDKESFDEIHKFSDNNRNINDSNNVDNEDSLNLTIGEDEEKIFQDEVCKLFILLFNLQRVHFVYTYFVPTTKARYLMCNNCC